MTLGAAGVIVKTKGENMEVIVLLGVATYWLLVTIGSIAFNSNEKKEN